MNICIIGSTFLPEMTGVGTHINNMMREYAKLGHKVLVLCPDYSIAEDIFPDYKDYIGELEENVLVVPVPSKDIFVVDGRLIQFAHWSEWNLEDYIGGFLPDALIVEDPARIFDLSILGVPGACAYGKSIGVEYAREKGIPVIGIYHTNFPMHVDCVAPAHVPTPYRLDKCGVYKKIFSGYDIILCACNEVYKFVAGHGLGNVKAGAYVGINQNIFSNSEKSNLVNSDENIKLFYAGKLDKDKDIYNTLEIFRNLKRTHEKVNMYIAGGGVGEDGLREVCTREKDIIYLGKLNQSELVKVYNSVDIYLSPHPSETYGLSILEAMSRGVPVVTADGGGPKNLVEKGVSGFRCTTMDEYMNALKLLAEDSGLRYRMGQAGKKFAGNYYCNRCADNVLNEIFKLRGQT
ncbi:MAG TPA: glycosyltransferase family 4 protein [Clostridia bacterium]|nr:glycosyltransferase family 4 protein [Clostridia bacterium]